MVKEKKIGDHRWFLAYTGSRKTIIRKSAVIAIEPYASDPSSAALLMESGAALCIQGNYATIWHEHFAESFKDLQADAEPLLE